MAKRPHAVVVLESLLAGGDVEMDGFVFRFADDTLVIIGQRIGADQSSSEVMMNADAISVTSFVQMANRMSLGDVFRVGASTTLRAFARKRAEARHG